VKEAFERFHPPVILRISMYSHSVAFERPSIEGSLSEGNTLQVEKPEQRNEDIVEARRTPDIPS